MDHNALLMRAFQHNEYDIEKLRKGLLPDSARSHIWRGWWSELLVSGLFVAIGIWYLIEVNSPTEIEVNTAVGVISSRVDLPVSPEMHLLNLLFVGMLIFAVAYIGVGILNRLSEESSGQVERMTGVIQQTPPAYRRGYKLMIDDQHFDVPAEHYAAFQHLQSYTIYYTPKTMRIVGAERYYGEKPKNDFIEE